MPQSDRRLHGLHFDTWAADHPNMETTMAAELEIITVGLATFLPDGSRMHVVMPATHGHAGHGIPEHKAVAVWRSIQLKGPAGGATGRLDLARRALEIQVKGHTGAVPSLPNTLVDISGLVKDKVDRTVVEKGPAKRVLSRLTLALGGSIVSGPTADFTLDFGLGSKNPTKEHRMPTFVTWKLPITNETQLEWRLVNLDSQVAEPFAPLVPILPVPPGGKSPRLTIFHVPANELPGAPLAGRPKKPKAGDRVEHFLAYYDLFDEPKAKPIPVLVSEVEEEDEDEDDDETKGGSTGTCMTVRAQLK